MPDFSHLDRTRAEGFGISAVDYDRYRPDYPLELVVELAAFQASRVLDIGCGTGRIASSLIERGIDVLGVEPDDRMASIARSRGVPVETSKFEQWSDDGRRFPLAICGAAWHWIEPNQGAAKATTVLNPGGTLARFISYRLLDDSTLATLDQVYDDLAPEIRTDGRPPSELDTEDSIAKSPSFSEIRSHTIRESRIFSTDEWLGMIRTLSDHIALGSPKLGRLVAALRTVINNDLGGMLNATSCTRVVLATRL